MRGPWDKKNRLFYPGHSKIISFGGYLCYVVRMETALRAVTPEDRMVSAMGNKLFENDLILPVDVVFAPEWWYHKNQMVFGKDFFYNPARRVEAERKMAQVLYERWGKFGEGEGKDENLPIIGPVHLGAGYLISEMLGCKVEYRDAAPPQVIPANRQDFNISAEEAFKSPAWKRFEQLTEKLKGKSGYLLGDVNWAGVLNIALDLRGQTLFMDMYDKPRQVQRFFDEIARVIERFVQTIFKWTGTTSITVNRNVRHLKKPVYLHSACSHTMISVEDYEKFLARYDLQWGQKFRPYGIHFCGPDPHRYAEVFAKLPHLDFIDVGWGGDAAKLRKYLPDTFLNIRLSPVEITNQTPEEIERVIRKLVAESGNPHLTGVCCINMDEKVPDEKVTAIFQTVEELRKEYSKK